MIAGPIQRSTHFLPQFRKERPFDFDNATNGVRQIIWGLFKKVAIADNLAPLVDNAFSNASNLSGPQVAIASIFFSIQIYCDFSGYTDIAIGLAKIMGFDLSRNFAYPYFATNIQEFWRRWHISLTSWFREYVYQPLGGSHVTAEKWARNILLVFFLSGLWHGANWTFICWGLLHGAAYIAYVIYARLVEPKERSIASLVAGWLLTMIIVDVGWIFFRAANVVDAAVMIKALFYIPDWFVRRRR